MGSDREMEDAVARCVSSLIDYRDGGRTVRAREVLEAHLDAMVAGVRGARLKTKTVRHAIIYPVMIELLARYETPEAMDLIDDFVDALTPRLAPEFSGEFLAFLP